MTQIITFCLVSFGMTQILVYGKIFDEFRPDSDVFRCTMCLGFWVGLALWLFSDFTNLWSFGYSPITGFSLGCLSSGVSYVLSETFSDKGLNIKIFCSGCKGGENE